MVAVKGKGWVLAACLVLLIQQVDDAYPKRDRSSDGSIGDAAHASRDSDHNPFDGFVHAVDIDEDIAPGVDLKAWVAAVEKARDPRVRYLIYEGRILKAYKSNGLPAWSWHRYDGPNSHSHHVHVSIIRSAAARDDLRPWPAFTSKEEQDMYDIAYDRKRDDLDSYAIQNIILPTLVDLVAQVKAQGDPKAFAAEVAAHLDGVTKEDVEQAFRNVLKNGTG
jgi:hypothetical protein